MPSTVRVLRIGVPVAAIVCLFVMTGRGWADEPAAPKFAPEQIEFFERHVRPVFVEHCHKCHGGQQQKGGLRLDSRTALLQGGDSGPAVAVEKPAESELLKAISYDPEGYQMPPTGKLPAETIARITEWVRMGAPWPEEKVADKLGPTSADEFAKRSSYWSFQPLKRVAPPVVKDAAWSRTPIDRFVLSRLEQAELKPAAETDRRTWLRRATFYATGLPPSLEEISAFISDESPDAYERVVDRLLDSPRFGERWGRHWLDLARYAESRGHEFDYDVANPWHFRDYVIRAMNDDVPFDRFVMEQVAGDLMPATAQVPAREQARLHPLTGANESLVATGFWLMGEWVHSPVDIRKEESERFDNMLDVYGKTFLGLTIACARCHDHKFDPITQKDYYALAGYLQSSSYAQRPFDTLPRCQEIKTALAELDRTARPEIVTQLSSRTRSTLDRLDEILLAAREALQPADQVETSTVGGDRISEIAAAHKLDAGLLKAWCTALTRAADDKSDPFSLWAHLATGRTKDLNGVIDEARRLLPVRPMSADGTPVRVLGGDGVAFATADSTSPSSGPMWPRAGAAGASIEFAVPGESRLDSDFAGIQTAGGQMNEPGAVGRTPRGGRTLRTETFSITADRIYCRVRGACSTYLSVDSHITLNGPLHGALFREQKGEAGWRWIEHDLSRYKGHRAHLEFLIPAGADFAVSEVRQGSAPPWTGPVEPGSPAQVVAAGLATLENPTDAAVALQVRKSWQQAAETAPFLNWMAQHPELFGLDAKVLEEVLGPWSQRRHGLTARIPAASQLAPCLLDGNAEDEALHVRGNSNKLGDLVPRRFLGIFQGATPPASEQGSGRLALAGEMVDPARTPILPRVIVNRLWHHAFGRGLVPTVDDFGHMGQAPSHPELLDWLATELLRNDWSLKSLHRQILLSATFRMDSRDLAEQQERITQVDPQNILLHRMNVQRLEGEAIRDAVLALSGRLDDRIYGPSVPIHLTSFLEGRGRPGASGPVDGEGRRSLYLSVRRNFLEPFLVAFDFPTPHTTIGRRSVSNVPAQALALMNNPLIQQQSVLWARRLLAETRDQTAAQRIARLYESALGRSPTSDEAAQALEFVEASLREGTPADDLRLWTELCHALVNVKEFVFLP